MPLSDPRIRAAKPAAPGRPLDTLTKRQREVLDLLVETGGSNRQIGKALGIAEDTVKIHLHHIMDKAGVSTRLELALLIAKEAYSRATPGS